MGLKFNFSMAFQSVIVIFYSLGAAAAQFQKNRTRRGTGASKRPFSYSRALTTASADRSSTCMVRLGSLICSR